MASTPKTPEPIAAGLKRVILQEISSAARKLFKHRDRKRDEAVHEARKSIKRIRGVLRVVRPLLGSAYSKESRQFQKLSRGLADFRDAAALLEVFDQLCGRNTGSFDTDAARAVREGLELDKQELESRPDAGEIVLEVAAALTETGKRVDAWQLELRRVDDLAPGLKTTYRRGRRAFKAARKSSSPDAYHDFRKRVKDRWYQAHLLEDIGPAGAPADEPILKQVGAWLGDHHNLAILRDRLKRDPERYGGLSGVKPFLTFVGREQEQLRQNSLAAGKELFAEKPSTYMRALAAGWQTAAPRKPAAKAPARKATRKVAG